MIERELLEWKSRALAAEKTAEVLKAKVWSFYNGDAQTTIQRQLARSERQCRELSSMRAAELARHAVEMEELIKERNQDIRRIVDHVASGFLIVDEEDLSDMRAAELARHALELEKLIKERTQDIRRIVDHVASGFLIVGEDLIVHAGFTKSCHRLLSATDVAGRYLPDLLRVQRKNDVEHLVHVLGQVFADILPEEICLDGVPRRYAIGDHVISLDASVIRGESGVEALLLTINDITSLEEAQRKVFANEVLIGILTQRSAFVSFVAEARTLLTTAREAVATKANSFVRRCLHTLKGNAAAFNLVELVTLVHQIESTPVISERDVEAVEAALRAFLGENASVLDISYDVNDDEVYELRGAAIDRLRADAGDPAKIEAWVNRFVLKRTDHVTAPLRHYAEKLAERLDKEIAFVLHGGEVMIDARYLRPLLQSLTHVLRNAVDHGIEPPDERGGKPRAGRLELSVTEDHERWWFEIVDDGRGIDTERVVAVAVEQGMIAPARAAALTVSDKLALVFVDGLSTRREVTDLSGRGVGMAALKAAVERLGGSVRIESTVGAGTRFSLSIPKPARRPRITHAPSTEDYSAAVV